MKATALLLAFTFITTGCVSLPKDLFESNDTIARTLTPEEIAEFEKLDKKTRSSSGIYVGTPKHVVCDPAKEQCSVMCDGKYKVTYYEYISDPLTNMPDEIIRSKKEYSLKCEMAELLHDAANKDRLVRVINNR